MPVKPGGPAALDMEHPPSGHRERVRDPRPVAPPPHGLGAHDGGGTARRELLEAREARGEVVGLHVVRDAPDVHHLLNPVSPEEPDELSGGVGGVADGVHGPRRDDAHRNLRSARVREGLPVMSVRRLDCTTRTGTAVKHFRVVALRDIGFDITE